MRKLEPPDTHHLSAAIGWLELGNPAEARLELEHIAAALRKHPDVLEAEWRIHAENRDWAAALPVAHNLVKLAPRRVSGWLHFSYALRRVPEGGLEAAWNALLPAYEKFPKEATVIYNLACYACQMGRLPEARKWLLRALKAGDRDRIKSMALNDDDLKPLWPEIDAL